MVYSSLFLEDGRSLVMACLTEDDLERLRQGYQSVKTLDGGACLVIIQVAEGDDESIATRCRERPIREGVEVDIGPEEWRGAGPGGRFSIGDFN